MDFPDDLPHFIQSYIHSRNPQKCSLVRVNGFGNADHVDVGAARIEIGLSHMEVFGLLGAPVPVLILIMEVVLEAGEIRTTLAVDPNVGVGIPPVLGIPSHVESVDCRHG